MLTQPTRVVIAFIATISYFSSTTFDQKTFAPKWQFKNVKNGRKNSSF